MWLCGGQGLPVLPLSSTFSFCLDFRKLGHLIFSASVIPSELFNDGEHQQWPVTGLTDGFIPPWII